MPGDVVVLLSIGRHPVSGRSRMAPADAAALELALTLTPAPLALHLGRSDDAALRDYLGLGLGEITVVEGAGPEDDILPALLERIGEPAPRLIIAGERAETSEASGMLPYLLARALGRPLLPQAVGLTVAGRRTVAVRQLPGGRRHRIAADGPVVVTVPAQGVNVRHPAFGPARRGRINVSTTDSIPDRERQGWTFTPARARPPRLRAGSARQGAGADGPLTNLSPREAAETIHRFLTSHGILRE